LDLRWGKEQEIGENYTMKNFILQTGLLILLDKFMGNEGSFPGLKVGRA
jgi:hypothetical protein